MGQFPILPIPILAKLILILDSDRVSDLKPEQPLNNLEGSGHKKKFFFNKFSSCLTLFYCFMEFSASITF